MLFPRWCFQGLAGIFSNRGITRGNGTIYRCERWLTPDGTVLTAPLPDGIYPAIDESLAQELLVFCFSLALRHTGSSKWPWPRTAETVGGQNIRPDSDCETPPHFSIALIGT